jgi:hypothetical protein
MCADVGEAAVAIFSDGSELAGSREAPSQFARID